MPKKITGKLLAKKWHVGVDHALYSHDGTWYHRLKKFPGALFDSSGFILFNTEEDYEGCSFLRLKKDCGCPVGISQIPGYIQVRNYKASDYEIDEPERRYIAVSRIIRDTSLSRELKLEYEDQCQICGGTVEIIGGTYSEAHHIVPLGSPHYGTDKRDNLIILCPTCHVKMDYFSIPLVLANLKVLFHSISTESVTYHNDLHRDSLANKYH